MFRLWQTSIRQTIPLARRILSNTDRNRFAVARCIYTTPVSTTDKKDDSESKSDRFKVFKDEEATIILDIEEERAQIFHDDATTEIVDEGRESSIYDQFSHECMYDGVVDGRRLVGQARRLILSTTICSMSTFLLSFFFPSLRLNGR